MITLQRHFQIDPLPSWCVSIKCTPTTKHADSKPQSVSFASQNILNNMMNHAMVVSGTADIFVTGFHQYMIVEWHQKTTRWNLDPRKAEKHISCKNNNE